MSDMPSPQTTAIHAYWNNRGAEEHIERHRGETRSGRFREHPIWLATVPLMLADAGRPIRRVADMGCGTGVLTEHLALLGLEVIGVEFAARRAEHARARLAAHTHAEIRVGDANDPPLAPGEVDAIVSRNLIWLLPEPARAIRRWSQLVAPGGRIAAIDATLRLDRSWDHSLRSRMSGFLGGRPHPVSHGTPTPLANAADDRAPLAAFEAAGLRHVRSLDLDWVTKVKLMGHGPMRRWLNRSRYYAVMGDA